MGKKDWKKKVSKVYFPISPDFLVAFCCKSLIHKIELSEKLGIIKEEGINLLKAIRNDDTFVIDEDKWINFYNEQQVLNSHRFLYGSTEDFSLAEEILEKLPSVKHIKSTVKLGEMGKAPPPNRRLPKGDILVIFGNKDHNILSIELIEEGVSSIKFKCKRNLLLELVLEDTPYERIEYYKDQHIRRHIGKPEINAIDYENGIFEVVHSDKAIAKILEEVIGKKKKSKK